MVIGLLVLAVVLLMVRVAARNGARAPARPLHRRRARACGGAKKRKLSMRNLLIRRGERSFGGSSYFKHVAGMLERADIAMRPPEFVAIQAGLVVVLLLIGTFVGIGLILTLGIAAIGAIIPEFWVRRKANSRRRRFEDQLGDTLGAVASSLRAGQSFQQAMSTISLDGPDPIAKEFQRVETEIRLGRPSDEALQAMAESPGLEELRVRRPRREHPAPGRRLALRDPRHGRRHRPRPRACSPARCGR